MKLEGKTLTLDGDYCSRQIESQLIIQKGADQVFVLNTTAASILNYLTELADFNRDITYLDIAKYLMSNFDTNEIEMSELVEDIKNTVNELIVIGLIKIDEKS
ncbi:MAG: hypothetical protein IJQ31_09615 [Thermoguttaceae bacterium]|nr:hypothetical protein [Thermoguttaceae bacterium]